jgi:hypothetical protein
MDLKRRLPLHREESAGKILKGEKSAEICFKVLNIHTVNPITLYQRVWTNFNQEKREEVNL